MKKVTRNVIPGDVSIKNNYGFTILSMVINVDGSNNRHYCAMGHHSTTTDVPEAVANVNDANGYASVTVRYDRDYNTFFVNTTTNSGLDIRVTEIDLVMEIHPFRTSVVTLILDSDELVLCDKTGNIRNYAISPELGYHSTVRSVSINRCVGILYDVPKIMDLPLVGSTYALFEDDVAKIVLRNNHGMVYLNPKHKRLSKLEFSVNYNSGISKELVFNDNKVIEK